MDGIFAALEAWPVAQYLRYARWGYAAVNTMHVFGVALLVGAIVSLNLRMLGAFPSVPLAPLVRVLVPVAAVGLALAIGAGLLLFSVRATEYADLGVFQLKMALVALGTIGALTIHALYGRHIERASPARLAVHAGVSSACWIGALVCGRLIAFAAE